MQNLKGKGRIILLSVIVWTLVSSLDLVFLCKWWQTKPILAHVFCDTRLHACAHCSKRPLKCVYLIHVSSTNYENISTASFHSIQCRCIQIANHGMTSHFNQSSWLHVVPLTCMASVWQHSLQTCTVHGSDSVHYTQCLCINHRLLLLSKVLMRWWCVHVTAKCYNLDRSLCQENWLGH